MSDVTSIRMTSIIIRAVIALASLFGVLYLALQGLFGKELAILYPIIAILAWYNGKLNQIIEKVILSKIFGKGK